MTWDGADAEGIAQWVRTRAKVDPGKIVSPRRLARMAGVKVASAPRAGLWKDATFTKVLGKPVIWLAPKLPIERSTFAICHELAEWALREQREESIEQLADAAAAAILAPRQLFREALAHVGSDLPELARVFSTTETCMGLRIGEVTAEPVALVSPKLVRVRGEEWGWPSEDEIRRLSRGTDGPALLRLVRLTDDARRVFLRAA